MELVTPKDIKAYRKRLLRHHQEEFDSAVVGAEKNHLNRIVDWEAILAMVVQLAADIGKDQAARLLIHLADKTAHGAFLSFDDKGLTKIS